MTDKRKKLLAINFFPAFVPNTSGGEQRYYMLYRHLSEQFDVTLLSATFANAKLERVEHSATFREIRVPKPAEVDQIHWSLETEGIGPECSALAVAMASEFDVEFSAHLAKLAADADAIIHESPFTLPYDKGAGCDGKVRVYNAYNIEYRLAQQMLKGEVGVHAASFIRDLEARLIACSSAILATSEEERGEFARVFGFPLQRIFLAPNGFDPPQPQPVAADALRDDSVLFLGSGHPPNVEALHYIAGQLAPAMPGITFNVVGSVCKAYHGAVPGNVKMLGFVSEAEKSSLLWTCGAAINPLSSGAGTNLKMLDYMAHAAPIVCTPVGARGLDLVDGVQASICGLGEFPDTLAQVLRDKPISKAMGFAGAALAESKYAWASIANATAAALNEVLDPADSVATRRRMVMVCDYEVHLALGGGQVRVKELLTEAGKEFDVTFLCLSDAPDEVRRMLAPGVVQRSIPKTERHRSEDQETLRGESVSVADLVAARHCLDNTALVSAFAEEVAAAEIVVFEQCFLAPLLAHVPAGLQVVYSSQNVEASLKQALLAARKDGQPWVELTRDLEQRMVERADLLVCVSEADHRAFLAAYEVKKSLVIENGVRIPAVHRRSLAVRSDDEDPRRPIAVFVGSGHPPNVQAVRFIIEELAEKRPEVVFAVVGSVCDAVSGQTLPNNVILLGFLERSEKEALFAMADLAVNPLFEGSGSSLKVPDFLIAGLPMLSSAIGARGFPGLLAGEHYVEADPADMAGLIPELLGNRELLSQLSTASAEYASAYLDWRVLGGKFRRCLRELMPRAAPYRALVLTYRFGEPARGGAEVFLLNTLRELAKLDGIEFDVVAPAIGGIRDTLHFSADYDPPSSSDRVPQLKGAVHLFALDPPSKDRLADARILHSVWMRESLELGRNLAEDLGDGLLGGWNFAENNGGRIVRWAAQTAQLRLPANSRTVTFSGLALEPVQVSIRLDGREVGAKRLYRKFSFTQELHGGGRMLELEASTLYQSGEDVRELAFLVDGCSAAGPYGEVQISLQDGLEERVRRIPVERWVSELVAVTRQRPRDQDQLFLKTRGPHSAELEQWLERGCVGYDVILAQGVPFSTSVLGVQAGARNGIPVVVLPHFHMEDRYYHWRQFYDAFSAADAVIAAPAASKPVFFDLLAAKAQVVAGGGLATADFSDESIARGREAFRALHRSPRPFVLVLGRKTGAKNYMMIVRACQQLREAGHALDVVIIGPDDDGLPLQGEGVYYYGSQPREVLIGGLADSLCLANMSESESFGIVLLESWMAGRPVVARGSTVAFTELVRDGENGFLADNVDDVAVAISRYIADPELAERHGRAGTATARAYGWDALAGHLRQILMEVVGNESRSDARRSNSAASESGDS
jgi:glycosyltransferase involved in cell wall biosynthesis